MKTLPPYTIRESPRAKRVILKVSARHGLEVVVPLGFSQQQVPRILERKKDWLARAFQTIQSRPAVAPQPRVLPQTISLAAVHLTFTVEYQPIPRSFLELVHVNPNLLTISGPADDLEAGRRLLKLWLQQQGRRYLIPWLERLSAETGLGYRQVQIRGQKSRWGSCSSQKNISLNYQLLFLRPELVRSLLIHELCHTVHLNHSPDFYRLWSRFVPDYQPLRLEMRRVRQELPWWAL